MKKIFWIVQKNLTNPTLRDKFKQTSEHLGVEYKEILVVPFSDTLDFIVPEQQIPVFYGSTTLMLNAYRNPQLSRGVFFDEKTFTIQNYLEQWGNDFLNFDSQLVSVEDLNSVTGFDDAKPYFIRPNADTKLFNGGVLPFGEFKKIISVVQGYNPNINGSTLISIASPKTLEKEWRNYIVGDKIISSVRYAVNGEVQVDVSDIPVSMLEFAQTCIQRYTPSDIFVLDVALTEGSYKVLECNCFNATGFYDEEAVEPVVTAVNEHLSLKNQT